MILSFNEITRIITAELESTTWDKKPETLYLPICYTLSLGGKRIRPALTLMACNLFSDNIAPAIKPALGIEVFHNFTLLHDDLMDRAEIRRGKPTVYRKWNDNVAILSGDVMQIEAYKLIAETPEKYLKQVLDLFSVTAAEICEGQQYDMDFETKTDVTLVEYIEMIRLKTAVLLGCALKTGGIIGGANAKDADLLYRFGIELGIAFQLKDDLLDTYGNTETFGKKIGGDIACNKKTFLLIHALRKSEGETKDRLHGWLEAPSGKDEQDKISAVTEIYNSLGIKEICEEAIFQYYKKSIDFLNNVSVPEANKIPLKELAELLLKRED